MNFYEAMEALDEIYKTEFNTSNDDLFYHFYSDLADLLNSLKTGRIYSNKNARAAQIDMYSIKENQSYVCMTIGHEGKERILKHFKRPLGISFTNLKATCDRKQYVFDPTKYYSQVAAKTIRTNAKEDLDELDEARKKIEKTDAQKDAKAIDKLIVGFKDFRINAIGKLADGRCFVSGGAGRSLTGYLHSKLFIDDSDQPNSLYKELVNWFVTNMNHPDEKHKYYHFKNDNVGDPSDSSSQLYDNKMINSSANLNPNYIPWLDTESNIEKSKRTGNAHTQAVAFSGAGTVHDVAFEEVYGIGPLQVEDEDGKVLLKFDLAGGTGGKGGYSSPIIIGADMTGKYSDTTHTQKAKIGTTQQLVLSQDIATKLYDLYDESEYRVYIPGKKDFTFNPSDIATIVLPKLYLANGAAETVNLETLVSIIEKNPTFALTGDKAKDITTLMDIGILDIVNKGVTKRAKKLVLTDITYTVISTLVELLTSASHYKNVTVEIIQDETVQAEATTKITTYNKNHNNTSVIPKSGKLPGGDKTRYLVSGDWPDMSRWQPAIWHGIQSVVAPVKLSNGVEYTARCGAETILIGHDANDNKYVLFIDNAHKSEGFMELPGGGLYGPATGEESYKKLAKHRLEFKAGVTSDDANKTLASQIDQFEDTGKALLLNEKGVAKDQGVTWPYSYYRLYTARYIPVINENDIDFSHDNRPQARAMQVKGEEGYIAFAKWIPVNSLDLNNLITTRYSNIISIIKAKAEQYTWNEPATNSKDVENN